jgi:hypothetical protein
MLTLLILNHARATCSVEQAAAGGEARVSIEALAEPVGCRTISVTSSAPLELQAWRWDPDGRRARLKADHLRLLPGGGWEIGAPELRVGGRIELLLQVPGGDLDVRLAPEPDVDLHVTRVDERRSLTLDPRHPGWGFADPKLASTTVERHLVRPADAPEEIVPIPLDATEVDAGGLSAVPGGVKVPAGVTDVKLRYTVPGAEPTGALRIPPGSFTLLGAGVAWVTTVGAGVTATTIESGVRFDAPQGGEVRWRVAQAGAAAVIPDTATWVAGLDWRFARVSLPEPAVPMALRGKRDRTELFDDLLTEVRALSPGSLPGANPIRPRQLNAAWRSRWATPIEQALILHRFLGQERFRVAWVLTGEVADPTTLTGFDHMLLVVAGEEGTRWIDPSCTVCAPGEIGTRWMGRPAVGIDIATGVSEGEAVPGDRRAARAPLAPLPDGATVPRTEGRLERSLTLAGDRFVARFTATGAAALWLRERLVGVDPLVRGLTLARALGMPDAALVDTSGFGDAGAPVTLVLEGPRPPEDPFASPDATPWAGGWGDAL